MRSNSRAAGALASLAALAVLAYPMASSAAVPSPVLPPPVQPAVPPLPTTVQQSVQQLLGVAPQSSPPASVTDPIVALLGQAASTPGVPTQAGDALNQLATALSSGNPPTAAQVASDLRSIARTAGVPSQVATQLNSLADTFDGGAPGSGGTPGSNGANSNNGTNGTGSPIPGFAGSNPFGANFNPYSAKASGRMDSRLVRANGAVIKSARYSYKPHTAYVVVACRAKTTVCNTAVAVYMGRRRVTTPIAKTVAPGRKATFRMRTSTGTARTLAKHGGVLRAVAVSNTPYGQAHSAESIHVRRLRH